MRNLFIIILLCLTSHILFSQKSYELNDFGLDMKFSPLVENEFEICNFKVGVKYEYIVNYERGTTPFNVKMADGSPIQKPMSFVAEEECKVFSFATNEKIGTYDFLHLSIRQKNKEGASRMMTFEVEPSNDPIAIIRDIFQNNKCFEIIESSIEFEGDIGTYINGESIGSDEGIIMSTGNPVYAEGPNNTTGNRPTGGGQVLDVDLQALSGGFTTYDVSTIEFDFIPTGGFIFFEYIFASEEYCDYVDSNFNDAFGFFLSGPGINGNFTNNAENLALVNGNDPVSINTINWETNFNQYVSNVPMGQNQADFGCTFQELFSGPAAAADFQYDGYTKTLTAFAEVQPCEVYHLKMSVADISDDGFDSAVFLNAGSFFAGGDVLLGAEANGSSDELVVYENCGRQDLVIEIERGPESVLEDPMFFGLEIGGTATMLQDYSFILPFYQIPAFQESFEIPVTIFSDNIPEGTETIEVLLSTACTCELPVIEIEIREVEPLELEITSTPICQGTNVIITSEVSGGVPEYDYRWSNGFTGTYIEVDPEARPFYGLQVEDECGNVIIDTIQLNVLPAPSAVLSGDEIVCDSTESANVEVEIIGEGPFELVVQNPTGDLDTFFTDQNTLSLPYSEEGEYQLVSVANNCPGEVDGLANIMVNDLALELVGQEPLCAQEANGLIDLMITGGVSPYEILWEDGSTDLVLENVTAGSYQVTVMDANACEVIESLQIQEPTTLVANALSQGISTCLLPEAGNITLAVSGGVAPYEYIWNTGDSTADLIDLEAGIYTATVTDQNGCSQIVESEIPSDNSLPEIQAEPTTLLNCNTATVDIITTGSSSGVEYLYTWTDSLNQPIIISDPSTLSVSEPGFYTLTITNLTNGCDASLIVEVESNFAEPTAEQNSPSLLNCANQFVELSLSNLSENTSVIFQSTQGASIDPINDTSVSVSEPGVYTVTLTNTETGCEAVLEFMVDQDLTPPTFDLDAPEILTCDQTSTTYTGLVNNPDYTYTWLLNNEIVSETADIEINEVGSYNIIVTNSLTGCTAEDLLIIENDIQEPNVSLTAPADFGCNDISLLISSTILSAGNSGIAYQWTSTDGQILSASDENEITIGREGEYSLTITDLSNGCTSVETVIVAANTDKPIIEILPFDNITCDQSQVILDASDSSQGNDFSFSWQANNSTILDDASLTQTIDQPGEYTLLITNTTNGCTSQEVFLVEQNLTNPQIEIIQPSVLGCENMTSMILLEVENSNYSYVWTASQNGNIISNPAEANIEVDAAGTYQVTVTNDLNGCTEIFEVSVLEDTEVPEVDLGSPFTVDCNQTEYFLSGSTNLDLSNAQILWTTTEGNIIGQNDISNPQISQGGTYQLTITNLTNGCTSTEDIFIEENIEEPIFNFGDPGILTCTTQEVKIVALNLDSNLDLDFAWSRDGQLLNDENTNSIEVNQSGEYSLLVTNILTGCTSIQSLQIEENINPPQADAGTGQELDCNVEELMLAATASVGSEFEYLWTTENGVILNGENTLTPTISASGTYNLQVTNLNNGCIAQSSVSISPNDDAPIIVIDQPTQLSCQTEQVSLAPNVENVSGSFSFSWSGPNNFLNTESLMIEVAEPGIYILTVVNDSNACESSFAIEVDQDLTEPQVLIDEPEILTCAQNTVFVSAVPLDSESEYAYAWSTSEGSILSNSSEPNIEVELSGTYVLELLNISTGCTSMQEIFVVENVAPPIFTLTQENVIDCNNPMSVITIETEENENLLSEWQLPLSGNVELIEQGDDQVSVNQAGVYSLILTNAENGCTAIMDIEVFEDFTEPNIVQNAPNLLNCQNNTSLLFIENIDAMNLSYEWFDQSQNPISNFTEELNATQAGFYSVIVTNLENGCTQEVDFEVKENFTQPVSEIIGDNLINCEITNVELIASGISAENTYTWLDASGNIISTFPSLTVFMGGTYTLLVTNQLSECSSEASFIVDQSDDVPQFELSDPQILDCRNATSSISVFASDPNLEFNFESVSGNIISIGEGIFEVDQPGVYQITATNLETACEQIIEVEVQQNIETPSVDAGPGFELNCLETSFQFNGTTNLQSDFSLQWIYTDPNSTVEVENILTPTVTTAGTYELTITNELNGCSSTDVVELTQLTDVPTDIFVDLEAPPCFGDAGGLDIYQIDGGQGPYLYSIDRGENFFDSGIFENLMPGEYELLIQDQNTCELETVIEIPETQEVFADLPPEIELEFGEEAQLQTITNIELSEIASIAWTPSTNLTCDDCLNPQLLGVENGVYTVTITNLNGCVAEATIQLRVDRNINVYIPNGFSPNNIDGINDVFMIFAKEGVVSNINSFQVYDRWGTKLFIQEDFLPNDPLHGWDGSFRNAQMNPGVFVYWAEIEFIDGTTEIFKGDVTLME